LSGLEAALLLGTVHAVVLAFVIRARHRNRHANGYLSALLGALALMMLDGYGRASGFELAHPHTIGLTAWVPFLIGPLLYLYVRAMTAVDPTRVPPAWHHLVITVVYIALLVPAFYFRSAAAKLAIATAPPTFVLVSEVTVLVHGFAYIAASLRLLLHHREHIQALYSNTREVSLRWLTVVVGINAIGWAIALAMFFVRDSTGHGVATTAAPASAALGVFVIGYFQLGQVEIFVQPPAAAVTAAPPAYQKARLPDDDASELETKLRAAMTTDKLYQRAGLTLAELADAIAATPHEVSQILSTRLGRNFYTFVNEYRVEHVKSALATSTRPVLDLALEAGFQSKSTFNAAFRKATGTTPSQYRERLSRGNS
jgi:AraC-like DNA-binding protein